MSNTEFDLNIPQEKFQFANGTRISDVKLDTKPIGFFKDALIRFRKNRGSVVAFFIICAIFLFAIIIPFVITGPKVTKFTSEYAKLGPRNVVLKEKMGIMGGFYDKEYSENVLYFEYAKGVAAEGWDGTTISVKDSMSSKYQPIAKVKSQSTIKQGEEEVTVYNVKYDAYVSKGFYYMTVTEDELAAITEWEDQNNLKVMYPLINKYSEKGRQWVLDVDNANYWYKMGTNGSLKGQPLDENGNPLELNEDTVFVDNYYRSKGEVLYKKFNGTKEHRTYEIRVLYYNYYIMTYGSEPNYLFGTDSQGYDFAVRLAKGIRLSIVLAISVSVINFVIGALVGAVEGYYGGTVDLIMERVIDILSGVPFIVVASLFQLYLAKKVGPVPSLIFAFVLTGWIGTAYRVRTQFYRFKNQEYVMAARTLGARDRRLIWKHIFPNTLGTIITSVALVIPSVIFSESSLSYLGIVNLGSSTSTSLGTLLSESSGLWIFYPHLMIFPAMVISLLMICFNLFGNGLRDAFNPSLRGTEE